MNNTQEGKRGTDSKDSFKTNHRALFLRRVRWFEAWARAYSENDSTARTYAAGYLRAVMDESAPAAWRHLIVEMRLLGADEPMEHALSNDLPAYPSLTVANINDRRKIASAEILRPTPGDGTRTRGHSI